MCAPTSRGAAFLAASVFIYRSIQLVIASISCAITGYKLTYTTLPFFDEFMLHLVYFIPLFTSSGFALMGIEESSFNFVFYSTLCLATTLFIRYTCELAFIYLYDWAAFRLKTPSLFLNIAVDLIFIATILIYAYQELRDPVKKKLDGEESLRFTGQRATIGSGTTTNTTTTPSSMVSSPVSKNDNIHNEFERKAMKISNVEAAKKGIGHGAEPGEALHYPITPVDKDVLNKPLPPLPAGTVEEAKEFDDISLPPNIPLASPDYDDV